MPLPGFSVNFRSRDVLIIPVRYFKSSVNQEVQGRETHRFSDTQATSVPKLNSACIHQAEVLADWIEYASSLGRAVIGRRKKRLSGAGRAFKWT